VPLPQIYGAAGAQLIFDPGPMAELVGLIEEHIDAAERAGQPKGAGVSKAG